jgi:histidyl-tRNA synthetase
MGQAVKSIKGVHDILPAQVHRWHSLERHVMEVMAAYGYSEMRTPILEKSELFKRSIGEVTDIVEKEMYTFEDRDGSLLSLRPENTASCVRAAIQHGLLANNQQSRIWYLGPMFRRENPQAGRYRQFWQVGAEVYGIAGAHIEAELILLSAALWQRTGLAGHVELQVNTLGTSDDRQQYRQLLVEYLNDHRSALDEDSLRRMQTNPLRVLDSKNPDLTAIIAQAPKMVDSLCDESREHFEQLQSALQACGIDYTLNPNLVRGLDYYSHTVFEWVTTQLGSQGTVCAGGRYDGLTEQLGAKLTPGVGWALGMERLIELVDKLDGHDEPPAPDVFMVLVGDGANSKGLALAEQLRAAPDNWSVVCNCTGGGMKSQFKRADKSAARVALVLGESELENDTISIKPLRGQGDQQSVPQTDMIDALRGILERT